MSRAGLLRHGVGYGLPALAAAVASLTWLSPGRFYAGGDVPPYLLTNTATELTSLWNHQVTGAGSTSYAILRAPDVALLALTSAAGGGAPTAQHVMYLLCAAFAAAGTAFLAGAWVTRPLARAAAGLLGAFNVFLLANYPNPLPAIAIGLTGLLAGLVLRAARGRPVRPLTLAVASLPLCAVAPNPALLVVVAAGVGVSALAGCLLGGRGAGRRVGALLARAAAWAVPMQLWWLVPYAMSLAGGGGAALAAQTDILAWSWSHARASLANVATLNAQWGWTDPNLYPYARAMDSGAGPVLRWLLPGLALLAPLLADRPRRRAAWLLAGLLVPVIVLSTGTHPPAGGLNIWLYRHVPGLWLLRDPVTKLGVPLVLGYAALAALTVSRLVDLAGRPAVGWFSVGRLSVGRLSVGRLSVGRPGVGGPGVGWPGAGRLVVRALAAVAVVAAVAYPAPLWTGAVAPASAGLLPGDRVAVPAGWYRLAGVLNADPAPGKVVILPLDPYYQVDTDWGFYGADEVPAELFRRPVLRQLPGGYWNAGDGVLALLGAVQRSLLDGDAGAAAGELRALGASHVVVRRDLRGSPYTAAPADPARIAATLAELPGVAETVDTPVGALFRLGGTTGPVQVQSGVVRVEDTGTDALAGAVARLGPAVAVSLAGGPPASRVDWRTDAPDTTGTVTVDRTGRYAVARPLDGGAWYRAAVTVRGGRATLRFTDAQRVTVDGVPLPPRAPLSVPLRATGPVTVTVSGDPAPVDPRGGLVEIGTSTTVTVYAACSGAVHGSPDVRGASAPTGQAPACGRTHPRVLGRAVLSAAPAPAVTRTLAAGGHPIVVTGPATSGTTSTGLVACATPPGGTTVTTGPPAPAGGVDITVPPGATGCAHTASVPAPAHPYRVAFEYRAEAGATARACVWQAGPGTCADLAPLPGGTGWRADSATVPAESGSGALTLYVYADGPSGTAGEVAYRDVRFAPAASTELLLADVATPPGATPSVAGVEASPSRYVARVHGASGPFVVTLAESYAPGWQLTGLPAGWTATHFESDGYANAWLVTGAGDATLTMSYRPEIWARLAIWVSLLAAALALLWWARRRVVARRRRARPPVVRPPAQRTGDAVPLVSIIVPTRDSTATMDAFLRSCLASTYRHVEIVLNDDPRSIDGLGALAARYRSEGLAVTYLTDNPGRARGRLTGAGRSRGDILMHLDSDMELTPELVAECVAAIAAGADALVVPEESFGTTFWAGCKWLEKRCYDGVTRIESLRVLTRACYQAVGGHDARLVFSEDKDLDLRVRAAGYRVGRTAAHLRHNEGHLTLRATLAKKRHYAGTADLFADLHPEHFTWQANILHRYAIYLRRVDLVVRHPLRWVGMVFLKTAECAAVAVGMLAHRFGRGDSAIVAEAAVLVPADDEPGEPG